MKTPLYVDNGRTSILVLTIGFTLFFAANTSRVILHLYVSFYCVLVLKKIKLLRYHSIIHVLCERERQTKFSSSEVFQRLWFNHFILGDKQRSTYNTLGRKQICFKETVVFAGLGSVFLIQFTVYVSRFYNLFV